jgi:peptide/nickel transport system substrate-binding protein
MRLAIGDCGKNQQSPRMNLASMPRLLPVVLPVRASLAALSVLTLLVGCGPKEKPFAAGGGTIVIAVPADPLDLFPPYVTEESGAMVSDLLFDRLADIGPELRTVGDRGFAPRLAKSWTWAPDSLSIAFALDQRARWHDGEPVTARDVLYSFKAFTDPKIGSPVAPLLSNVDSVSVRDSLTAVAWFKKRTPEQFYELVYQLKVMPEHIYSRIPTDQLHSSEVTRKPVGSGRFRFGAWQPGSQLELVADTSNYRGRAQVDRVILGAREPSAVAQVLKGDVDFTIVPWEQASILDTSRVARPITVPRLAYGFMGMNAFDPKAGGNPHPIFSDVRVRRALSMAVDRGAMLRAVFGDKGRLGRGPFPMALAFADSATHVPPFDTVAARSLLDSAGWVVGPGGIRARNGRQLRFSLMFPASSPARQKYSVLLQNQLRRVGVAVDVDTVNLRTMLARLQSHDFDALLEALVSDPSVSGLRPDWSTAGIGPGGANVLRYSNHTVDALFDSASRAFDPQRRAGYLSRAYEQIAADAPAIWLYDVVSVYAVNRRINLGPTRADAWWANLADWSIPADKRLERDRGLGGRK